MVTKMNAKIYLNNIEKTKNLNYNFKAIDDALEKGETTVFISYRKLSSYLELDEKMFEKSLNQYITKFDYTDFEENTYKIEAVADFIEESDLFYIYKIGLEVIVK